MLSIFSFPNVIANYSFHLNWDSSKVYHQRHTFSIVIFEILKIDYRSLILPFGIATNDGYRWEDYQALLTAKWERMGSHIVSLIGMRVEIWGKWVYGEESQECSSTVVCWQVVSPLIYYV